MDLERMLMTPQPPMAALNHHGFGSFHKLATLQLKLKLRMSSMIVYEWSGQKQEQDL